MLTILWRAMSNDVGENVRIAMTVWIQWNVKFMGKQMRNVQTIFHESGVAAIELIETDGEMMMVVV